MLAFRNVSFSYASTQTLLFEALKLTFSRGFTGVIGPNGAGKTTLLHLATNLLAADAGSIEGTGPRRDSRQSKPS